MDFVGKRGWFFLLSALIIFPGIVFLVIPPALNLGIDFTGGSTLDITFTRPVDQEELRAELSSLDHADATIQSTGDDSFFLRLRTLQEGERREIEEALAQNLAEIDTIEGSSVSALVAGETVRNAIIAVFVASIGILLFITWAFRNVPKPFRYGVAAVIALIHDVMVILGVFAVLGQVFEIEVNRMFIVGLLTVIGYSVNDTIVVFDRVRENVSRGLHRELSTVINLSLMETIGRSLNTSLTLVFTLLALILFGGPTLFSFLLVLIIGVVSGTYSSIGIASQVLMVWESGDIGRILGRLRRRSQPMGVEG